MSDGFDDISFTTETDEEDDESQDKFDIPFSSDTDVEDEEEKQFTEFRQDTEEIKSNLRSARDTCKAASNFLMARHNSREDLLEVRKNIRSALESNDINQVAEFAIDAARKMVSADNHLEYPLSEPFKGNYEDTHHYLLEVLSTLRALGVDVHIKEKLDRNIDRFNDIGVNKRRF